MRVEVGFKDGSSIIITCKDYKIKRDGLSNIIGLSLIKTNEQSSEVAFDRCSVKYVVEVAE